MNKIGLFAVLLACTVSLQAQKDYKASMFGIRSDGTTLNTNSIQKAIDYISENGGGRLVFYVGRYLTGTVYLKSNVTIQLDPGAGLVSSTCPYDYDIGTVTALVVAKEQQNVGITGIGFIEGDGAAVSANIGEQGAKGNLPDGIKTFGPALIYFENCTNVALSDILVLNAGADVAVFTNCNNVNIAKITIKSNAVPTTKGFVLTDCTGVTIADCFVDVPCEPLFMKGDGLKDAEIRNCITAEGKIFY